MDSDVASFKKTLNVQMQICTICTYSVQNRKITCFFLQQQLHKNNVEKNNSNKNHNRNNK